MTDIFSWLSYGMSFLQMGMSIPSQVATAREQWNQTPPAQMQPAACPAPGVLTQVTLQNGQIGWICLQNQNVNP